MPNLDRVSGLAACGTAGGRVSYGGRTGDQRVVTDGGAAVWLRPGVIAFLGPSGGSWAVPGTTIAQTIDVQTLERLPLDSRQPSYLAAGGGRYQAAMAGQGGTFGSCGEFPGGSISRTRTDMRGAAAADGTIALLDSYQSGANGFRLSRPDGSIVPPAPEPAIGAGADYYDLTVIDAHRAIWPAADAWGTFGITPAPVWIPGSGRACWIDYPGAAYLVHWLGSAGLVARRADSTKGKILSRAAAEFHYDAIAWEGGIRIAWCHTEGEPPGSLVVDWWDGLSDLEELWPAPPEPPIEPIEPIAVTITASPTHGPVPLAVRAEATITNGPAASIAWQWRPRGASEWRFAVTNPGTDPDHTFRLDAPGEYEISAVVDGANGRATSEAEPVTATPAPEPPHPPQPRTLTKDLTMDIDGKIVQLRGAGLRLLAPDAPGTGIWGGSGIPDLREWRGVLYVTDGATAARYKARKVAGDRYVLTNVDHDCVLGADGGQYSTGLDRQGYHKPTGNTDAGELEQWRVYEGNEIGSLQAQVEQTSDASHPAGAGKKIVAFPLTVEIVS